jgi:hypothetical protein
MHLPGSFRGYRNNHLNLLHQIDYVTAFYVFNAIAIVPGPGQLPDSTSTTSQAEVRTQGGMKA